MAELDQLEALRAIKRAREAGDERAELQAMQALRASQQFTVQPQGIPAEDIPGFAGVALPAFGKRVSNAALNIPSGAGNLLAEGAAAVRTVPGTVSRFARDEPLDIGNRFSGLLAEEKSAFPASLLRAIPTPTANQLLAAPRTAGAVGAGLLGGDLLNVKETFAGEVGALEEKDRLRAEQRPFATAVGNMAGDIATLLTGRAPFVRAASRRPPIPKLDATSKRLADQIVNSKVMQSLKRGTGRAAETGLEGAILAALQDGNPIETAAYTAGLQAAGSVTLQVKKAIWKNPGKAALAAIVAHSIAKSIIPGGRDSITETIEESFDEISLGLVLGVTAGVLGLGRLKGTKAAETFPQAMDALATVPRGAVVSLVQEMLNEDDGGNVLRVLTQYFENPDFFGEDQAKIERAITNEKVSLSETVNQLIDKGKGFAGKLDAIGTQAAEAITQESFRSALSADNLNVQFLKPTEIANKAARILGIDRAKRLGFEGRGSGPKAFISNALRDEGAIETMRKRLSKSALNDVLRANLDNLITNSMRRVGDSRVIDGERLRQQWDQLPAKAKELYDETQRAAIEAFIDTTSNKPLAALPPLVSQALMAGGELVQKLIGKPPDKPKKKGVLETGTNF